MGYWQGKIVLVTGGSAGLGFYIARCFAAKGAQVVIASRNKASLDAAKKRFDDDGYSLMTIVTDVTNDAQVALMVERIVDHFGGLDVLVNNVGKSGRSNVLETTPDDFQELMEINFLSVVRCSRAALPHLTRSRGHLINIASLAAKTAPPYMSAYSASKFAVAAYTQQLRVEGPREVHCLLVCPGPIDRGNGAENRYRDSTGNLPEAASKPGAGAKLSRLSPKLVARRIVRAAERNKPELVLPAKARILFVIAQMFPRLGDWIVRKMTD